MIGLLCHFHITQARAIFRGGVKILNFNIFGGGFRKNEHLLGYMYEDFGGITKLDYV